MTKSGYSGFRVSGSRPKAKIYIVTNDRKIGNILNLVWGIRSIYYDKTENIDNTLDNIEKILLDFGVEGKIKRISCGPVVTLNEFEPASGIKVSKIVNLADDIARHTSSVSTRVATIPGKNTIGIEIPNAKNKFKAISGMELLNIINFVG